MTKRGVLVLVVVAVLAALAWFATRDAQHEGAGAPTPPAVGVERADAPDAALESPLEPPRADAAVAPRDAIVAAPEATADSNALVVRVLDDERRPVEGATVSTPTCTPPAQYASDADGRVRVPLASIPGTSIDVDVSAVGHVRVKAQWQVAPEIPVVLARAVRLRGRVLEKGTLRPIGGARIAHYAPSCKGCEPDVAVTDAGGRYALEQVAAAGANFLIGAPGFPEAWSSPIASPIDVAEHDFVLDPGVAFSGQVVDLTTGAPIAGAVVVSEGQELAHTDANGRFSARASAEGTGGTIDVRFGAEGACWLRRVWIPEELVAQSPLRVPLPRGAYLEVRVRDESGRPVAGVEVITQVDTLEFMRMLERGDVPVLTELLRTWRIEAESDSNTIRTDADGRFRTPGFVPHTPLVKVWTEPSESGRIEERAGPLGAPGETLRVDAVLGREAYATIAGRMLQGGKPVRGRVQWRGATRNGGASTDAGGLFVLEHVEPGRVVVQTRRDPYRENRVLNREDVVELVAGQRVERDFDVELATRPATGRVVRTDGGSTSGLVVLFMESPWHHTGHRTSAPTEDAGRFTVDLPDDRTAYKALVYVDGHPFERDGVRAGDTGVEIVVGEVPDVLCRAIDAETREPVARIEVYARADGAAKYEQVAEYRASSAQGWHELEVGAGAYDLVVRSSELGYVATTRAGVVVAPTGETRVEVEMTRGASVELRLADGVAPWPAQQRVLLLEEALAEAVAKLDPVPAQITDLDPRFPGIDVEYLRYVDLARSDAVTVRGLAPGRYRLFDARRELALEPEWIEVRRDPVRVAVRWQRR